MLSLFNRSFFAIFAALLALTACAQSQNLTPIPAIQGSEDISPFDKKTVVVEGVVTAGFQGEDQLNGFFLQDPQGDGDAATSDGIFVYVSARSKWAQTAIKSGDKVRVAGRVEEYHGQTQIGRPTNLEVLGQENLPTPTEISLPLPENESLERFEGMLVKFAQSLRVIGQGDLQRYGVLLLAPQRLFVPTNQKPVGEAKKNDLARQTISLDDGSGKQGPKPVPYFDEAGTRRIGDAIENLTGILNFDHDSYRVQPTIAPVFRSLNPRPKSAPVVGGNLKIAAANLYNYWTTLKNKDNPKARGADSAPDFARQSAKTVAALRGLDADIVGLMELENNGTGAIDDLVGKLNAAYKGRIYAAVSTPATGLGHDAIRVGMIYKIARLTPRGAPLSASDGVFDRRPLAQTFIDNTTKGVLTVMVNHFKSKGSCPETGDIDTGEGCWANKRNEQAKAVLNFVKQIQTVSKDEDVLVLGDLNAYSEETPIQTLRAAGLKHLNLRLAPEERYSYGYDSQFGSLDHALATPSLDKQITNFAEWHINADEPYFLAYKYLLARDFEPTPYRASDHDPLLLGVSLKSDAAPLSP